MDKKLIQVWLDSDLTEQMRELLKMYGLKKEAELVRLLIAKDFKANKKNPR